MESWNEHFVWITTIPESMIPDDMRKMLQSDNYELAFICSEYESATDEVNEQIKEIDQIVKDHSKGAMVIGEAPLMKDLQDVTDIDLKTVNANFDSRYFHHYYDRV